MGKRKTKKDIIVALPNQCFWIHDGPIVSDIEELLHALKHEVSEEQFSYHANSEKNDFDAWIRDALGDSVCANALMRVRTKKTAVKVLTDCLKEYKKK